MIRKITTQVFLGLALLAYFSLLFASGAYVNFMRTPEISSQYELGQKLFSSHNCTSCHKGNIAFTRSQLLRVRGNLAGAIASCKNHSSFCSKLSSTDRSALVYYLRVRYRL